MHGHSLRKLRLFRPRFTESHRWFLYGREGILGPRPTVGWVRRGIWPDTNTGSKDSEDDEIPHPT